MYSEKCSVRLHVVDKNMSAIEFSKNRIPGLYE